jgi:hypothetical protein
VADVREALVRRAAVLGLFVAAVSATLSACGGDDGGGSNAGDEAAIQRMEAVLTSPRGYDMTNEDARCIAEATVSSLGAERVEQIDFESTETQFDEEEAALAIDAFVVCVDLGADFANSLADSYRASDESRECLLAEIDEEQARRYMTARFSRVGLVEAEDELAPDLRVCLTADESTLGERVPS